MVLDCSRKWWPRKGGLVMKGRILEWSREEVSLVAKTSFWFPAGCGVLASRFLRLQTWKAGGCSHLGPPPPVGALHASSLWPSFSSTFEKGVALTTSSLA